MSAATEILRALEEVRTNKNGSFAILVADAAKNYYAQFSASDDPGIYVELVGNDYLDPVNQLDNAQQDELKLKGWQGDGSENWYRTYSDETDSDLQLIARDVLMLLHDIYGASDSIDVTLQIEKSTRKVRRGPGDNGRARRVAAIVMALLAAAVVMILAQLLN